MIGIESAIKLAECRIGEDASYMRDLASVSRRAFWGFAKFSRFAGFRKHAPVTLINLARLGAMMAEDCGTCVRITVRLARQEGADPQALKAGSRAARR